MAEAGPVYSPFFGVMGAASAIIFSGKLNFCFPKWLRKITEKKNFTWNVNDKVLQSPSNANKVFGNTVSNHLKVLMTL